MKVGHKVLKRKKKILFYNWFWDFTNLICSFYEFVCINCMSGIYKGHQKERILLWPVQTFLDSTWKPSNLQFNFKTHWTKNTWLTYCNKNSKSFQENEISLFLSRWLLWIVLQLARINIRLLRWRIPVSSLSEIPKLNFKHQG